MKYEIKVKNGSKTKVMRYEAASQKGVKKLLKMAADMGGVLYDMEGNAVQEFVASPDARVQILIDAINAEWVAIRQYEAMKPSFSEDEQKVIEDILQEEKVHVGQFQAIMDKYAATNESVAEGVEEAQEQEQGGVDTTDDMMPDIVVTDDFVDASIVRKKSAKRNANKGSGKTYSEWFDEDNQFGEKFDDYVKTFPNAESLRNATAQEIWDNVNRFYDIYPVDSTDRENAFNFVSEELNKDYGEIYDAWRQRASVKRVHTRKVRASVQEAIDDEVITEEEARQAYALGLADALKEDVELDLSAEIEVEDPQDHDQVEQAIYDMGTQDGESIEETDDDEDEEYDEDYSEFEEFDDDIDFDGMEEEE